MKNLIWSIASRVKENRLKMSFYFMHFMFFGIPIDLRLLFAVCLYLYTMIFDVLQLLACASQLILLQVHIVAELKRIV